MSSFIEENVKYSRPPTLFPVLADTNKERRALSIFLTLLPQIPDLAEVVFSSIGQRIGKRTQITARTEVCLTKDIEMKDRPDGLVVLSSSKGDWTALIEAKIGNAELTSEQVCRYLEAAKANGINAVITISNQFVARADHSPVPVPNTQLKKVELYHWSWAWLRTQCQILELQSKVEDKEQKFLLEQFVRFLEHDNTGVSAFDSVRTGRTSFRRWATTMF